ncbi:uncharacterized protein LOC105916748 [Fundulus heteroclitus]|uniref:uncharacterized protein LOC105916748 n=1 Tax=Fundulus heteroclitus TaxID=8078 RepID=UPI00165CDCDC|nr:uncharacterized protein LOC105916748 [Fundulus heteroclitus]
MAAFNRPLPAHSERDGRNPNLHSNGGMASSVQQDPSPHGAAQDPGFRSLFQHPIFGRPVMYFHPPPPPPLLHYQWPTPFSYNPFAGFPSMGYGTVVPPPPFPPAPYMDMPGYFLPHPPVPPVDYRRLHHPQAHTQGATNQNPYQMSRIPPNHCIPGRETVNSEVQTESAPRSIHGYDVGSESGRGTFSSPPCSPALSSPKQTLTELINCKLPCREDKELNINEPCTNATVKSGSQKRPIGSKAVESCGSTGEDSVMKKALPDQEPVPDSLFKDGTDTLWLSSPDGVAPVSCSSQNNDVVLKERRVSAPGVLMNRGGGTPQTSLLEKDVELSRNGDQLSHKHEVQPEKPSSLSSTETNTGSVVGVSTATTEGMQSLKGSEVLFRILRLPYPMIDTLLECSTHEEPTEASFSERPSLSFRDKVQYWQNSSQNNTAEWQENHSGRYLHEISDVAPHMSDSSCQANRNFNESFWSVESLPPFIPSREWLLENGLLGPKVNEVMEEAKHVEDSNKNDTMVDQKRKSCGLLSCVSSVQMSESCLCSGIQQEEQSPVNETGTEIEKVESDPVEAEQSQSMLPSEENVLSSCASPDKAISTPSERDENENRSSEHDSSHSPNQKSFCLNELQQTSLSSSEEKMSLSSAAEEIPSSAVQLNGVDTEDDGAPAKTEVSPSKGTLVDFGVQCNAFHEQKCLCEGQNKNTETHRRLHFKSSDMKKKIYGRNGHMQKRKNGQWRSTGQEWQFN